MWEDLEDQELGHVIYAIGLTGDFRTRPFDTIESHVGLVSRLLQRGRFTSFLYLSTTRVYLHASRSVAAKEDAAVFLRADADSLYDLSKLLGESLCLTIPSPMVRIARLSNVYGLGMNSTTFLGSILDELTTAKSITIHESIDSGKDYIAIDDVVKLIEAIALKGKARVYNLASGRIVTHKALFKKIHQISSTNISYGDNAPTRLFPEIDISRCRLEFNFKPVRLFDRLDSLLKRIKVTKCAGDNE